VSKLRSMIMVDGDANCKPSLRLSSSMKTNA